MWGMDTETDGGIVITLCAVKIMVKFADVYGYLFDVKLRFT